MVQNQSHRGKTQDPSPGWHTGYLLLLGELATILYVGCITKAVVVTGLSALLFPELAALSYDVFTRPRGTWAQAPFLLVLTPALAAVAGVLIEQHLDYGYLSVLLGIAIALLIIGLLKSPIAPAISAGLLPIVIGEGSWWYPATVLVSVAMLSSLLLVFRKVFYKPAAATPISLDDILDDAVERPPRHYRWVLFFVVFLLAELWVVNATGLRFILFPPLVVIGYEMFSHPLSCSWADRPIALIFACMLTAFAGTAFVFWLGAGALAAILAVVMGTLVCRIFRLHVPPVLAIGLLPMVMPHPDYRFPLAVGSGTFVLSMTFMSYRYLSARKPVLRS